MSTAGDEATVKTQALLMSEALRNLELPVLPPPGGEGSALQFGDWVTIATPLMCDISNSASSWWDAVLSCAEKAYLSWLKASPVQKLRLKPEPPEDGTYNPRVEQRGISMLLAALPDQLRREVVAARKLSATTIMYRLYTAYQPGGGSERASLLKYLTDMKVSAGLGEILQAIRLWRRWLARAEELHVVLPDGLVLMQTLTKVSEQLSKQGGQTAFRLASARQELGVDVKPVIEAVKEYAEFLQAEAEDLALMSGSARNGGGAQSGAPTVQPAVKAFQADPTPPPPPGLVPEGKPVKSGAGPGAPCKFWGSEGGCRRGEGCGYQHDWTLLHVFGYRTYPQGLSNPEP